MSARFTRRRFLGSSGLLAASAVLPLRRSATPASVDGDRAAGDAIRKGLIGRIVQAEIPWHGNCSRLLSHRLSRTLRICDLLYPSRVVGIGAAWPRPDGGDLPEEFQMICEYLPGVTVYVLRPRSVQVESDCVIRGRRGTLSLTAIGWIARRNDGRVLAEYSARGGEQVTLAAGVLAVNMARQSWRSGRMIDWDNHSFSA